MIPTDHEYTVATTAAAKRYWDTHRRDTDAEWDEISPFARQKVLELVLPLVDAALTALPDRAEATKGELKAKIEMIGGGVIDDPDPYAFRADVLELFQ